MRLWELLKEDYRTHFCDFHSPGFRAVAVHRLGTWRRSVKPAVLRKCLGLLHRWLYRRVCDRYGIELPATVQLGRRVIIQHRCGIIIHANAVIGDECLIHQGVTIGQKDRGCWDDVPRLGKGVEVGAGAVLLGRITVGDYAKIGANAVVLTDVPAGATAVGIPARIVHAKKF